MLETKPRRFPITDIARFIATSEDPSAAFKPIGDYPADWQKWEDAKPEMYAICAVLGNDVVMRALTRLTTPQDIVPIVNKPNDSGAVDIFANLLNYTMDTLSVAFDEESAIGSKKAVWERYEELNRLAAVIRRKSSSHSILRAGQNTAVYVMTEVLELIPHVYKDNAEDASPETLAKIASDSFPLIAQLAMLPLGEFAFRTEVLRFTPEGRGLNSSQFDIREAKNGPALAIKDEAFSKVIPDREEPHVGCPAMVKVDETSAVRKFWDWYVSVAPQIYGLVQRPETKRQALRSV